MRTLDSLPKEKQIRVASETSYIYAPLAYRLGLYSIRTEMEDLVLKYTEPEIYHTIFKKISETHTERESFISEFIFPLKEALTSKDIKFEIFSRQKSINSIWNKIKTTQVSFEEVYDIFAVRIVIDTDIKDELMECMKVLSVVESIYKSNPNRFRNWLYTPRANGYQALHTTVMSKTGKWVEVQIRSKRMDDIAEKGYAAHWKYKGIVEGESALDEWLSKIREVLQNLDQDSLDFLDNFKMDLFSDEIYTFTPKGDMITLPKKATALDFAYHIHTNIGNRCIGAKVNHKLVTLDHKLKSGDQVEIITSEKQMPQNKWLSFVKTAKATLQIKQILKEEHKKQIEEGKNKLEKMFSLLNIDFSDNKVEKLRNHFAYPSNNELFLDVYNDIIKVQRIKHAVGSKTGLKDYFIHTFTKFMPLKIIPTGDTRAIKLAKEETSDFKSEISEIVIATCCDPIPGDDIIGYKYFNQIVVHRTSCETIKELSSTYGHKITKVHWDNANIIHFFATIRISGIDRIGIIRDISKIISEDMNINIKSFNLCGNHNIFEGEIKLYISDIKELKNLISKLKKVKGVSHAFRTG